MKDRKLMWIAGPTLGLALLIGGCGEKKGDEAPPTGGTAPTPLSEKSPADQPKVTQGTGSDTGTAGSAQGQKPEEKTESSQKG